jgi:threonine dehydrogenase-like Zn-dependent dehydrogenase
MIGVTHDGGMAEYAKIAAQALHGLPAHVTLRQGALVEPLSVALHGVRRSRLKAGDDVLIMGAGPIGLLTLQCARLAGARRAIVSEVDPARAALAHRLGATTVLNPARDNLSVALADLTDGLGPEVIFICTGAPCAVADARVANFRVGVCVSRGMDFVNDTCAKVAGELKCRQRSFHRARGRR